MGGLGDYAVSIKMRDAMIKMAEDVVERMRPRDRYGVVQSVDTVNRKCSVLLTGDLDPISVNMGFFFPISTGQTVRVAGAGGDKYLADIFAGIAASQLNAPYIRGTSTSDASAAATNHPFQLGSTNSDNVAGDNDGFMARLNGAAKQLLLSRGGSGIQVGGDTGSDDATDEVKVGRLAGLRTVLNYNQLRALSNNVASTLYLNYSGGIVETGDKVNPGAVFGGRAVDATARTTTSTSYSAASTNAGLISTYPKSGCLLVVWSALLDNSLASESVSVSFVVRDTNSGGTARFDPNAQGDRARIRLVGTTGEFLNGAYVVTGLPTSGAMYVGLMIRSSAAGNTAEMSQASVGFTALL